MILVGIVVIAGVLMWLVGREAGPGDARRVDDVDETGLILGDEIVAWSSLYEVRVISRRELLKTWYGFEVRTEDAGLLSIDGSNGRGERFLAGTHQLPGFDHDLVRDALTHRRSGVVCYNR